MGFGKARPTIPSSAFAQLKAQLDTVDAVKAALPEKVNLVKASKPPKEPVKPVTRFKCVISGTPDGYKLNIGGENLPTELVWDFNGYDDYNRERIIPLEKFGKVNLELTLGESYKLHTGHWVYTTPNSLTQIAETFLKNFRESYERCITEKIVVWEDE